MGVLSDVSLGSSLGFIVTDSDPRVTAVDAFKGSLVVWIDHSIPFFTPQFFYKRTSGLDTNVIMIIMRNNYNATVDPVVTDDTAVGFEQGSEIYNTTTGKLWKCVDASLGAAVWVVLN